MTTRRKKRESKQKRTKIKTKKDRAYGNERHKETLRAIERPTETTTDRENKSK